MLIKSGNSQVIGTQAQSRLSVRPEDVHKVVSLMIQKYHLRTTPIREVVINGLETTENAVRQGREFRPVEIGLNADTVSDASPFARVGDTDVHYENAVVTVTDHGEGMSPEFMSDMFTSVTASTKDQDKDAIGGLGIGSKSVLSLTDYATWRTVKDGVATVMVISTDNEAGFAINHESVPTDDENGTTVTIPVSSDIMRQIVNSLSSDFLDYVSSEKVVVTGNLAPSVPVGRIVDNIACTTSNGTGFLTSEHGDKAGTVHLLVNGAPYPTPDELSEMDYVDVNVNNSPINEMVRVSFNEVVVNLDQNEEGVMILGSREALVNDGKLNDLIRKRVIDAVEELANKALDKMTSTDNPSDFIDAVGEIVNDDLIYFCRSAVATNSRYGWAGFDKLIYKSMVSLAGDCDKTNRNSTLNRHAEIVDAVDGNVVTIQEILGKNGEIVMGKASVREPSDDFKRVQKMNEWQKMVNHSLVVSTTDNMANALVRAKSITDIVGDVPVRFFVADERFISSTVWVVTNMFTGLGLTFNDIEPDDFCHDVVDYITKNITVSEHKPDEIRDMVKAYARKVSAANRAPKRRRTRQERMEEASIHVLSFKDGVGYEVEEFFPSVPKLEEWLDKEEAHWVSMTEFYHFGRSYSMVLDKSMEEKKILSESVPDRNLRIVLVRKDTLLNRVVELNCGHNMARSYSYMEDFLDNAQERAIIFKSDIGQEMDGKDTEKLIKSANALLEGVDASNTLLHRLAKEFPVKEGYRQIMDTLLNTAPGTEVSGWRRDDHDRILFQLDGVKDMFVEGEVMIIAQEFPATIVRKGGEKVNLDAVELLRRSVDMVSMCINDNE